MRIPEDEMAARQSEINIVPLIDIIFCILVFFIVASLVLTRSEGLDVNLPGASTSQPKIRPAVTVSITADNQIAVNQDIVELEGLLPAIEAVLSDEPEEGEDGNLVVLNADLEITHGSVVDVMNELRKLEDVRLAIATRNESEDGE